MAGLEGGSVVLASKDYRLYVYRYAPAQVQYAYPFYTAHRPRAAAAAPSVQSVS